MQLLSVSCARNESSNSTERSREGEDKISNLPDFIIGYILNFLSTKQAVLTSVLSKRWKYMWTLVTKLNFDNHSSHRLDSSFTLKYFPKFVSRVLFHLNSTTIEEFTLRLEDYFDEYYINQWIFAALDRRVKKIYVSSWDNYYNQINLSSYPLFESHSLEELVFNAMSNSCIIKLRSFVCLPCLTVLKLSGIEFTCYSSHKLKELTLNLPLLREYETDNCTWSNIKSITIEAPLLEKFSYRGDMSSQTILLNGQHIRSAELRYNGNRVEEIWIFLRKLLHHFVNAELLHLSLDSRQIKSPAVEHYLAGMPVFQMLRHLRLKLVTSDVLLGFLLKSPCLKTLDLQMADYKAKSPDFAVVPDCFLSTLEVVKFDKYFGGECELSFVKFVMENSKVLERISFSFHPIRSCSKVEKAKEKLSCLVKVSFSTVIMEFPTYDYVGYFLHLRCCKLSINGIHILK